MDLILEIQTKGRRALVLRHDQSRPEHLRMYKPDLKKALNLLGLPIPDEYLAHWRDGSIECVYRYDRVDEVSARNRSHRVPHVNLAGFRGCAICSISVLTMQDVRGDTLIG